MTEKDADRLAREDDELRKHCGEVDAIAAELARSDDLGERLSKVAAENTRLYTFKQRLKGATNLYYKVVRKHRQADDFEQQPTEGLSKEHSDQRARRIERLRKYRVEDVTDAWGVRFVTLYQNDIPKIVEAILASLGAFNQEKAKGQKLEMKEAIIYTNRPETDPLSIVRPTQEVIAASPFASDFRIPEIRQKAYSSVHLVFSRKVLVERFDPKKILRTGMFEIQVRDIFEEAWGEIEHDLNYKRALDPLWGLHLGVLKTFVDGCSQHASMIRRHLLQQGSSQESSASTESITDREKDRARLRDALGRAGADEEAREAVSQGYQLLINRDPNKARDDQVATFLAASEHLGKARRGLREEHLALPVATSDAGPEPNRSVGYFLAMEEANCLFQAGDLLSSPNLAQTSEENVRDAERAKIRYRAAQSIFAEVFDANPNDSTSSWRLAKPMNRLAQTELEFGQTLQMIEASRRLITKDEVTGADHWLALATLIDRGFTHWVWSRTIEKHSAGQLDHVVQAAAANIEAIDTWKAQSSEARVNEVNVLQAHKAASSILYYVALLLREGHSSSYDERTLREYMAFLAGLQISPYRDAFRTRDNIMLAHEALGELDSAKAMARETFQELRGIAELRSERPLDASEVVVYLHAGEKACFEGARRLLSHVTGEGSGLP